MLCSFTKGVKTVSFLNLSSENTRGPPARAPRNASDPGPSHFAPGRLPQAHDYRVIEAGSWHNRFPGDIRIELDYTRLVSFYDTASFPSLQPHRFGQERFFHRLNQVSTEDLVTLTHQLDEILGSQPSTSSGIQWRSLINVITNRYAERLEMLEYTLNATPANGSPEDIMGRSYRYVRSMLITYIVHDAAPSSPLRTAPASDRAWAQPVFEACVAPYSYSDIFVNADATSPLFSRSEELLASSVKSVVKEICRVLVSIWAEGVELGLQNNKTPELKMRGIDAPEIVSRWSSAVSDLIQWLDWSYWVRCKPSCSYDVCKFLHLMSHRALTSRKSCRRKHATSLHGRTLACQEEGHRAMLRLWMGRNLLGFDHVPSVFHAWNLMAYDNDLNEAIGSYRHCHYYVMPYLEIDVMRRIWPSMFVDMCDEALSTNGWSSEIPNKSTANYHLILCFSEQRWGFNVHDTMYDE